jgi:DNA-binding LytR/AlgR family response regulator
MPTALLLEDEPLLADELAHALAQLWPELAIVHRATDGNDAIAALTRLAPDIAFLDVRVPGAGGLDVARAASGRAHVVFVTAFDDYAVEAFDQGAIDYVVKPIDLTRLAKTVLRLKSRIGTPPPDINAALDAPLPRNDGQPLRWLQASVGDTIKFIAVRDVLYFQSDNKYTRIVRAGDEAFVRKPLKDLAAQLDARQFWQIHRATLVNVDYIDTVARDALGAMSVVLKGRAERLPVSKAFQHLFRGA